MSKLQKAIMAAGQYLSENKIVFSLLKGTSSAEKIGFALIILSLLLMIFRGRLDNITLERIMQAHEVVFWLGMLIWATGLGMREHAAIKKSALDDETSE